MTIQPFKLDTKSLSDENGSNIKQPTQLKLLQLNEIQKSLWIKLSREDSNSLIKDVANNLNNDNYKTTVNNHAYNLKNAEKFLLEITIQKLLKMNHVNCMMI